MYHRYYIYSGLQCQYKINFRNITVQNPQFSYGQGVIMGSQVLIEINLYIFLQLQIKHCIRAYMSPYMIG